MTTTYAMLKTVVKAGVVTGLIALALLGVAGCSKKKPPAPPRPPPPPPPPPPVISFESVRQEMKADARLQFADGLSVTDETFARAAVAFADALVKGDGVKMREYLGRRGMDTLGDLQEQDLWEGSTKNFEGLRFVVAQPPPTDMAIESGYPEMDATLKEATEIMNTWKRVDALNTTPEDRLVTMASLEKALREYAKKLKETGRESEFRQIDQYVIRLLNQPALKPGNIFNPGSLMTLLLAVQEPGASYVMGWQAYKDGDRWKFDPASTTDATKPRAADWDAVGVNAFALVNTTETLLAADGSIKPKEGGSKPADAKPETSSPNAPPPARPSGA